MITKTGAWIAETDYTNYPKDKMCFMDRIAQIILRKIKEYNYKVETTVTNICEMCLAYAESFAEDEPDMCDEYGITIEGITNYIEAEGRIGLSEFDCHC
jgi:hypothetical protein